jgi:hypothetical protein
MRYWRIRVSPASDLACLSGCSRPEFVPACRLGPRMGPLGRHQRSYTGGHSAALGTRARCAPRTAHTAGCPRKAHRGGRCTFRPSWRTAIRVTAVPRPPSFRLCELLTSPMSGSPADPSSRPSGSEPNARSISSTSRPGRLVVGVDLGGLGVHMSEPFLQLHQWHAGCRHGRFARRSTSSSAHEGVDARGRSQSRSRR